MVSRVAWRRAQHGIAHGIARWQANERIRMNASLISDVAKREAELGKAALVLNTGLWRVSR